MLHVYPHSLTPHTHFSLTPIKSTPSHHFLILYTHPSNPLPLFFTCMNLACMATHHTLHAPHTHFPLTPIVEATSFHHLPTFHACVYSFHAHFSINPSPYTFFYIMYPSRKRFHHCTHPSPIPMHIATLISPPSHLLNSSYSFLSKFSSIIPIF